MLSAPFRLRPTVCFILMALPALARPQTAPTALPTNGTVTNGAVTLQQDGATLRVNQASDKAIVNWDTFNIGRDAAVQFLQPGAASTILNRVLSGPSDIAGKLTSNGRVYLVNPNGVLFGASARVDVGGLVVAAGTVSDGSFLSGAPQIATRGRVDNAGAISTAAGGSVVLAGASVGNSGSIAAPQGAITLAAGDAVRINLSSDGLIQAQVTLAAPHALVANSGSLDSAGGQISLAASASAGSAGGLVIESGIVRAGAVRTDGGTVSLIGGSVEASGSIDTSSAQGKAGAVDIFGDLQAGSVRFDASIDARGALQGGLVETSAAKVQAGPRARVNTLAANGRHGTWLIDPQDFTIGNAPGDDISGLDLSLNLAQGNVTIQSAAGARSGAGDIFVNAPINWENDTILTLSAERSIVFASGPILDPRDPNGAARANLTASSNNAGLVMNYGLDYRLGENMLTLSGASARVTLNGVPYTVINGGTAAELETKLRANLGGNYVLGANIDASATAEFNNGLGWEPIGANDSAPFTGRLHGFGHVIQNLTIDRSGETVGLFGILNGTVRDLGLRDPTISGSRAGAFAGELGNSSTLQHVFVAGGSVTGNNAGGLAGATRFIQQATDRAVIENSYTSNLRVDGNFDGTALIGSNYVYGDLAVRNSFYNAQDTVHSGRALGPGAVFGDQFAAWLEGGRSLRIADYQASLPYDSATDRYGLSTVQGLRDLLGFANSGIRVRMTGDLDLANEPGLFLPTFNGDFDGANHTVSNLTINYGRRVFHAGLFGLNSGRVANVKVTDAQVGGWMAGGIAGANTGTIENTSVSGEVGGASAAGGLVGTQLSEGQLLSSTSTAAITGSSYLGGVIGNFDSGTVRNTYYDADAVTINDIVGNLSIGGLRAAQYADWSANGRRLDIASYANVLPRDPASGAYVISSIAGMNALLGFLDDPALSFRLGANIDLAAAPGLYLPQLMGSLNGDGHRISNLRLDNREQTYLGLVGINLGTIRNLGVTDVTVNGDNFAGGLVGDNRSSGRIETSFSSGAVSSSFNTGGVAGFNDGVISNSYSTASVGISGLEGDASNYPLGGLVGQNIGIIQNSLATGAVATGGGGLVGLNGVNPANISNSFWNIDTSGVTTSAAGSGKSSAELAAVGTYTGWDFANTWRMVDGTPSLRIFSAGQYDLLVDALDLRRRYGAGPVTAADLSVSVAGLQGDDTLAQLGTLAYGGDGIGAINAGNYSVLPGGLSSTKYDIVYLPGAVTIDKAPLTLSADSKNKVYGDPDPVLSFSASGLQYADTSAVLSGVTLTAPTGAAAVAGQHAISLSGGSAANYTIASATPGVLTVAKRALSLGADNKNKVYGDPDPALSFSASGLQYADTVAVVSGVTLSAPTGAAAVAGQHAISLSGGSAANYTIGSATPGVLTVAKRALSLSADSKNKVYGDPDPVLSFSASGLQYADTVAVVSGVALSAPTGAAAVAGQHAISLSGGSAANYTIGSATPGLLTVAKRALSISIDNKNKVYGDPDPVLSYSASGLQYADTSAALSGIALSAPTGAAASAGQHAIVLSGGSAANYTIGSATPGVLTVAKRALSLSADSKNKVYGDPDPALSFSASGLQYADTGAVLSGVLLSAPTGAAAGAGTHPIAISGGSAANYLVGAYTPGVLTVAKRQLVLAADNQTGRLGAPVPPLTYSASGLQYTDTPAQIRDVLLSADPARAPGQFPILISGGDAGPNYAVSTVNGILNVEGALIAEEPVPVQSLMLTPVTAPRMLDATAAGSVALAASVAGGATPQRKELFVQAGDAITRDPSIGSLRNCGDAELGDCIARPRTAFQAQVLEDTGAAAPSMQIKRKLALVIGNNDYHSPLSRLEGAGRDAGAVAGLLRQQGYEVEQLADANRSSMIASLNRLIRTSEPDDSVLVFYAGHGYIHPGSSVGYWIPTDANVDDPRGWLSNIDIARFLANMPARQLLLVSDSCFSGALTREGIAEERRAGMSRNAILMRRSVVALSSGGEEVVADSALDGHSPFTYHLLRQLGKAKGEIPARDMLLSIRDQVSKSSAGQVPSYGIIMSSGHASGGEYLLNPKSN